MYILSRDGNRFSNISRSFWTCFRATANKSNWVFSSVDITGVGWSTSTMIGALVELRASPLLTDGVVGVDGLFGGAKILGRCKGVIRGAELESAANASCFKGEHYKQNI